MFFSLIAVGGVAYLQYSRVDRARRGQTSAVDDYASLPIFGEVPDFHLSDRSGKPVSLSDLRGKIWIADFIFAYCGGPCPIMTERMSRLQSILLRDHMEKVRCVSITVDPARDTPEVLSDYANRHGASPNRWYFLTGDKQAIYDLAIKGFKVGVEDAQDGSKQPTHSTRFMLVDRTGRIRGYYRAISGDEEQDLVRAAANTMDKDEERRLLHDVQSLVRESGQ
jgi:protein SCO1/2